jgi:hypothetical protein
MKETEIVQFRIDDETTVMVEVEKGNARGGVMRTAGGDKSDEVKEAERRFDEALDTIRPAAERVLKLFQEMNTPDEIGLEFGVKFGAKAGVILASADSEATFKVSLNWKNKKDSAG